MRGNGCSKAPFTYESQPRRRLALLLLTASQSGTTGDLSLTPKGKTRQDEAAPGWVLSTWKAAPVVFVRNWPRICTSLAARRFAWPRSQETTGW